MGASPPMGGGLYPRFFDLGRVGSYRLLVAAGHTDFLRPFQLTQPQTLIPFKIMTFPFSGGDPGGAARKMSVSQIPDLRLGSFVGARDCYTDSNAPTLIKIGGILEMV